MKRSEPAIQVSIARKVFPAIADRPEHVVLGGVELTVERGSFVVLTGPSGCGKSTMLNIIAGLDDDYQGTVSFGKDTGKLSFMFQTPRLLPWRTVEENVLLVLDDDGPDAKAGVAADDDDRACRVLHGGTNALLWNDLDAMEQVVRRDVPLLKEQGGYIFATDHSIPSSVSAADLKRILAVVREVGHY